MMLPVDYTTRAARFLLGVTAHPGGVKLSEHLLDLLDLTPGSTVVDVACGAGTTLDLLRARGHRAVGIDLTPTHLVADAHALPLRGGVADAVVVECSLSTFDRPAAALAEAHRVLRAGGRLGVTDIVLDRAAAGPGVTAAVDRLTTARTMPSYALLLKEAGFEVQTREDRGTEAAVLVRRLRRRLPLSSTLRACEQAVRDGSLSYGLLVATKVSASVTATRPDDGATRPHR